ncbi:hypothetical protein DENSPDRAFT_928967 [Dentipellis sp. KUC8613]|nr:hypothetical protein DENSPDRAFT_928967 [Dentipellis sp. KUC8613]
MVIHKLFLDEDGLDVLSDDCLKAIGAAACNLPQNASIMGIKIVLLARFPEGVPVLATKKEVDENTDVIFSNHTAQAPTSKTPKLTRKAQLSGLVTPSPTPPRPIRILPQTRPRRGPAAIPPIPPMVYPVPPESPGVRPRTYFWGPPRPPPTLSPLHWTPEAPFPIPAQYVDKLTKLHALRDEAQELRLHNAGLRRQLGAERKIRLYVEGLLHPKKEGIPEYAREARLANRKRQRKDDDQEGAGDASTSAQPPRKRQREDVEEYDDVDPRDVHYEAERAAKRKRDAFSDQPSTSSEAPPRAPKRVRFAVEDDRPERSYQHPARISSSLPLESDLTEEDKAYEDAERAKDVASGDPRADYPEWLRLGSFSRGKFTLEELVVAREVKEWEENEATARALSEELVKAREGVMRASTSRTSASASVCPAQPLTSASTLSPEQSQGSVAPEQTLLFGSGPSGHARRSHQSSIFSTPLVVDKRVSWPPVAASKA